MMPGRQEIDSYVNYLADCLAEMLPENPVTARRVVNELYRRIKWRPTWLECSSIAAIAASAVVFTWSYAPADAFEARIVHGADGQFYMVIYEYVPGEPTKVLRRTRITHEDAHRRVKTPGWRDDAIASFRGL